MREELAKDFKGKLKLEIQAVVSKEEGDIDTASLRELLNFYDNIAEIAPPPSAGMGPFAGFARPIPAVVNNGADHMMDVFMDFTNQFKSSPIKKASELMQLANDFRINGLDAEAKLCVNESAKIIKGAYDESLHTNILGRRESGEEGSSELHSSDREANSDRA